MRGDSLKHQEKKVHQLLQLAFAPVLRKFGAGWEKRWTLDVLEPICRDLITFTPEDFHDLLPRILLILLEMPHTHPTVQECVDAVVTHLNGPSRLPERNYESMREHFGARIVERHHELGSVLQASKPNQFALITPEQARAIVEWLRLANTWEGKEFYEDVLEVALVYWQQRATE